jgi:hypothetical protein
MTPVQAEAWAEFKKNGSIRATARALGLPYGTAHYRIKGAELAENAPEGQKAAIEATGTQGIAKAGWRITKNEDGSRDSVYWRAEECPEDRQALLDEIIERFNDIRPVEPTPAPAVEPGGIAFFPHQDWHFGMAADETVSGQDYNREIAIQRFTDGMRRCMDAIPPSEVAIILANGDTLHANDNNRETPASKHKLRVIGTHRQNVDLVSESHCWAIDEALKRHGRVIYRPNPGNHDPSAPDYLIPALKQRYRNEPRVQIEDSEGEWWSFQQGAVFLCAHHGHVSKPKDLALTIPAKFRRQWGISDHWYFFTGHYHSAKSDTFGGVKWQQLPALCVADDYSGPRFHDTSGMLAMWFADDGKRKNTFEISF